MASIPSRPGSAVESPASSRELATLLAEAVARGRAVTPVGGGTKVGFGNLLSREAIPVSTRRLNRILAYEPEDMTVSIEGGAPIALLWNELGARGQTIPIDVPEPETETIGGLIATGLCGPRRFGSGSLRDALIGIQVAYPDGTLGRAGGMVVKNVSGFDLMRMHLGALGTLGVVVSANFKVLPLARSEATVTGERESIASLEDDRLKIQSGRIRPIAFEARRSGEGWILAIRIEGRPATVDQMARELGDGLGGATTLPSAESCAFWNDYVRGEALPPEPTRLVLQVRGKPSDIIDTSTEALNVLAAAGVSFDDVRISLGLGTVRLALAPLEGDVAPVVLAIHQLRDRELSVLLLNAPAPVHQLVDAFGTSEPTLQLMRALKRQFDPWSALNPGRVIPEL